MQENVEVAADFGTDSGLDKENTNPTSDGGRDDREGVRPPTAGAGSDSPTKGKLGFQIPNPKTRESDFGRVVPWRVPLTSALWPRNAAPAGAGGEARTTKWTTPPNPP